MTCEPMDSSVPVQDRAFEMITVLLERVEFTPQQRATFLQLIRPLPPKKRQPGSRCATNHPGVPSQFVPQKQVKNGRAYVFNACRACARAREKRHYREQVLGVVGVRRCCPHPLSEHGPDDGYCYHETNGQFTCGCEGKKR